MVAPTYSFPVEVTIKMGNRCNMDYNLLHSNDCAHKIIPHLYRELVTHAHAKLIIRKNELTRYMWVRLPLKETMK